MQAGGERKWLNCTLSEFTRENSNGRQINMELDRLLMPERNLLAFPPGLLRLGCFRLALTVAGAAALRSGPHEVLFTRDAAAPNNRREEQQRQEQIGKRPSHSFQAIRSSVAAMPWGIVATGHPKQ
jgi:hypothetical protein